MCRARHKEPSTWNGLGTIASLTMFAVPADLLFVRGGLFMAAVFCALLGILMHERPRNK